MLKQDGKWIEVEWQAALEYVANGLRQLGAAAGPEYIGALATPHSTLEELALLQKLMRGIGSHNVDFRLRQSDFSADGKQAGAPWLGMPVAELSTRDRFLVVGSFLRKDHPLLAQRIRQAVKRGAQANIVHAADDELLMPVAHKSIVQPGEIAAVLAQILKALAAEKKVTMSAELQKSVAGVSVSDSAVAIARSLASGERVAVLLGNFAQQHPQAAQISMLAEQIASLCGAQFGFLGEAANSVGGYLAGAVPFAGGGRGMNAAQMLASPRKAYLLLNVEPELDMHDAQQAMAAMRAADMVVALSAYRHHALDYADVLLPIAPFTETSGTFVNTEGRAQSFKGAVKPLGEARPAWKVLRVLGNLLDVPGFEYDSSEAVRDELLSSTNVAGQLNNRIAGLALQSPPAPLSQRGEAGQGRFQRVSDVPIYAADAVVRRAASLQNTHDAATPCAALHSSELKKLGLQPGDQVKVKAGQGSAQLAVAADDKLPTGVVRVAAGHAATAGLGAMFGEITVERA
jgi:NADH-quinone oxidoreductase subunit G